MTNATKIAGATLAVVTLAVVTLALVEIVRRRGFDVVRVLSAPFDPVATDATATDATTSAA